MQSAQLSPNKWIQPVSLGLLFVSIAAFAYTGNYLFLCVPVGALFVALLGLNWKTAYWILLFCIPISVELSFMDDTLSTSLPDEPMTWLFLGAFILMWMRKPNIMPQWWWRNPLVFVIVLQFLWLIIAVIFSKELFFSVKFLISKTWYLVVFFALPVFIFKEKKDFKKAFILMLITLLITMVIIMIKHYFLHFSFAKVKVALRYLYYNHVEYSTVLSMFFPLVCVAYPLSKGKPTWLRITLLLIILFFIPALYFTYARAAMIAVVFAIVVAIALRMRLLNLIMPGFYAIMILGLAYMINHNKYYDFKPNFERTYMHKNFADHMIATFRGQDMSSMERLYRWVAGIRMSADRPITGYGPHAFYYYYKPYAVTAFKTYVSRNPEHSTTHNYYLYMLVEQGWPAMLLYALLVPMIFYHCQKIYWRFKDRFYRYVTLGLAMMFAACFINNFFSELLESHKVGGMFYLCVAAIVILDKKSKDMQAGTSDEESIPAVR